jgi:indole-3-glycerol phosphate synthase
MSAVPDLLRTIVAAAERITAVRRERESCAELERRAARASPAGDQFEHALAAQGRVNVIAECKRRSPSKGVLMAEYDPAAIASKYERGGAAAISVLTEPTFFDGSLEHLRAVRAAVSLPLLRKDFIVDEYQLLEARAAGADAILLIVASLDQTALARLQTRSADMGLAALVAVSESGLQSRDDLERLSAAGYGAFLIGERFMTDPDPVAAIEALIGDPGSGIGDRGDRGSGGRTRSEGNSGSRIPDPGSRVS